MNLFIDRDREDDRSRNFHKIFMENSGSVIVKKGNRILQPYDSCNHLPIVEKGSLRVYLLGEDGKEVNLYYIEEGESCILSANCILTDGEFPVYAQAMEDSAVRLVPAGLVKKWIQDFPIWREYIYETTSSRVVNLLTLFSEVLFEKIDKRIARHLLLLHKKNNVHTEINSSGELSVSHQEIADSLGCTREVVSRILKEFEHEGILRLKRMRIELSDPERLKKLYGLDSQT